MVARDGDFLYFGIYNDKANPQIDVDKGSSLSNKAGVSCIWR
jgi:hypothetical protein